MEGIYKMFIDFRRMGELESVFVADSKEVEKLIGKEVYFGEVLGKHSDVFVTIKDEHITLVSEDSNVVNIIKEHGLESGFNPFDYIGEDED